MAEYWTQSKTLELIEAFRSNECLWKVTSNGYSDRTLKTDAWKEVALTVGCEIHQVERKMKTLKTQFTNYHKQAMSKTSGSGTGEVYKPKWFAYNSMLFLVQHRASRRNRGLNRSRNMEYGNVSMGCQGIETEGSEMEKFHSSEMFDNNESSDEFDNIEIKQSVSFSKPEEPINPRKKTRQDDVRLDETYNYVTTCQCNMRRDEFTVFGEHVAFRLRNIVDSRARLIAQHQINNILFESEIGK